jgi:hypothetical protein
MLVAAAAGAMRVIDHHEGIVTIVQVANPSRCAPLTSGLKDLATVQYPAGQVLKGDVCCQCPWEMPNKPGFTMFWWKSTLIPLCLVAEKPFASNKVETA